MAVGDIITAARYNSLQSRVATVMGVGSGDDGYGQNLNSAQVNVNDNVQAIDINQLYTDMANGRILIRFYKDNPAKFKYCHVLLLLFLSAKLKHCDVLFCL